MSIISKAVEKQIREQNHARRIAGVEELPGSGQPKAADVIQQRSEPQRAASTPLPSPEQRPRPRPATVADAAPRGMGKLYLGLAGFLAAVGIGAGYFMVGTSAPVSSISSPSQAAHAQPDPQPASAAPAPTADTPPPAPTPVVVRVEVAVKSEGPQSATMIPVDRQTLLEVIPAPAEPKASRRAEPDPAPEEDEVEVPEPPPPPPARPARQGDSTAKPTLEQVRGMFKVDGIYYGDGDPMAIINNEIVREGFEGEGFAVIKIKPDSVVIRLEGADFELR